jgi:hypothetical protein
VINSGKPCTSISMLYILHIKCTGLFFDKSLNFCLFLKLNFFIWYYNLQMTLSQNYVFFPFYSLLNVILLICCILLLWQTHLMGVNIGFLLMILHIEKENTLRCADLLLFNNNSIAHNKFILIFLKEHSKATTYIN